MNINPININNTNYRQKNYKNQYIQTNPFLQKQQNSLSFNGIRDIFSNLSKRKSNKTETFALDTFESRKKYLEENLFIQDFIKQRCITNQDIDAYAELDETHFNQLRYLIHDYSIQNMIYRKDITTSTLTNFAKSDKTGFKQIKNILRNEKIRFMIDNGKIKDDVLKDLIKLDKAKQKKLNDILKNYGIQALIGAKKIDGYNLISLTSTDKNGYKQLINILKHPNIQTLIDNKNIDGYELSELAWLDETKAKQANDLLNNSTIQTLIEIQKVDGYHITEFSQYDEPQFEKLTNLLNNNGVQTLADFGRIDGFNLSSLSKLDEARFKDMIDLLNNCAIQKMINDANIIGDNIVDFSKLDETKFKQLITLLENSNIQTIANKEELNGNILAIFADFEETEFKQLNKLLNNPNVTKLIENNKINNYNLYKYVYNTKEHFEQLYKLLDDSTIFELINNDKIRPSDLGELPELDEKSFERAKTLLVNGFSFPKNRELLENDLYYNRALELISKPNIRQGYILYFAKIEDENEYNQIMNLANYLRDEQIIDLRSDNKIHEVYNSDNYKKYKDTILKINNSENLTNKAKDIIVEKLLGIYESNYSKLSLKEKIARIETLKEIQSCNNFTDEEKNILNIDNEIAKLKEYVNSVIATVPVSKNAILKMGNNFFKNNNPRLDNLLSSANYNQYGKEGLPLNYSRKSFLKDLSKIFAGLSEAEKNDILNKLDISLTNTNGEIGYNGIINLNELSKEGTEGKVLSLATKFIKENSIQTGDSKLDETFNSLIEGMPEFINIIGKKQHATQDFSLDIHTLTVLKEAINNPEYQNLSDYDKYCLKIAIILHDFAKSEGVIDSGHAQISALYARDILNKSTIILPTKTKNRICELVNNHHWLADYNTQNKSADEIAVLFRRKNDLKIAQIMAEADLKGVKADHSFYNCHANALDNEMQTPILKALSKINGEGQIFFTNKIINPKKVPIVEYKGKKYKVINFTQLPKDTDMYQYGFELGSTVENLRFFLHMVNAEKLNDLENVYYLADSSHQGYLCSSFASIENHPTYYDYKFGVSLEAEQINIANAQYYNQASGCEKDFSNFSATIRGTGSASVHRELIPNFIKTKLNLTNEEYAELFEQIQKLKFKSQLNHLTEMKIGEKHFSGKEIKEAILMADDLMLKSTNRHSEANLYSPKINAVVAKVDNLDDVPQKLLDYAEKHNLPIYLIGE